MNQKDRQRTETTEEKDLGAVVNEILKTRLRKCDINLTNLHSENPYLNRIFSVVNDILENLPGVSSILESRELNIERKYLDRVLHYFRVPQLSDVACDLKIKDITFRGLGMYITRNIK